jgi:L-amino acid N-acyltransferase YncA
MPSGKQTDLSMRLSLDETRAQAIEEIARIYDLTGDIEATAAHFEIGKRTLERWVRRIPELAIRIEKTRAWK